MHVRRILTSILSLGLALASLVPSTTYAADDLVTSVEATGSRLSITALESAYENSAVAGSFTIQNPTSQSVAGATIQVILDQMNDGKTQRLASLTLDEPLTLGQNRQVSKNFSFTKEELSGMRNGRLITSAIVRSTGSAILAYKAHHQTISGLTVLQDVSIVPDSGKLEVAGESKPRFELTPVEAGKSIHLLSTLQNKSTSDAVLTPVISLFRTREAYNRSALSTTELAAVTVTPGATLAQKFEVTTPSQGGKYVYYLVYKDSSGNAVTTRESYQVLVPGASASIAQVATEEAAGTWTFQYTVPVVVTISGPVGSGSFSNLSVEVTLKNSKGTALATATKPLPEVGIDGHTETVSLPLSRSASSEELTAEVVLSQNGTTSDALSVPVSVSFDTNGFRNKVAVLGGSLLALLVLIIGLIVLSSRRRAKARHYIPLMIMAGICFLAGFSTVKAETLEWSPELVKGGGATTLYDQANNPVGDYGGSPSVGCLDAEWTATENDVTWMPSDYDDPDTPASPDIKGQDCESSSTSSGDGEPEACDAVPVRTEDIPFPVPKAREKYVSEVVDGFFDTQRDYFMTPNPEVNGEGGPVNGLAYATGPKDPFECEGDSLDYDGGMYFSSACVGWYPSLVYVDVFFTDPSSPTDTIESINYFYGMQSELVVDSMDYEFPGCKAGETYNCTFNWVYPPDPCDPGGPGTDATSSTSGTTSTSSTSSISSISATSSTSSTSVTSSISATTSTSSTSTTSSTDTGSDISATSSTSTTSTTSSTDTGSDISATSSTSTTSTTSTTSSTTSTSSTSSTTSTSSTSSTTSTSSTSGGGSGQVLNFGSGSRRWQ